jgi:hypothetical protein
MEHSGKTSEEPTMRGRRACAEWLSYCLSIGWSRDDLDGLEEIFWRFKDRNGRLKHGQ